MLGFFDKFDLKQVFKEKPSKKWQKKEPTITAGSQKPKFDIT